MKPLLQFATLLITLAAGCTLPAPVFAKKKEPKPCDQRTLIVEPVKKTAPGTPSGYVPMRCVGGFFLDRPETLACQPTPKKDGQTGAANETIECEFEGKARFTYHCVDWEPKK